MNKLRILDSMQRTLARLRCVVVIGLLAASLVNGRSQGTVTFNNNQVAPHGTNYYELGMAFNVIIPTRGGGSTSYDGMVIEPGNVFANIPSNSTPYMSFFQQFSPDDYVVFSLTNGYSFGLTSVNLADPNSPSLSPVPISFIGFLGNGSSVTNTFTTPGGGATSFLNYTFTSAFASGLTSVDIFSTRWAMDNLVFGNVTAPEPGIESLIAVGLLAFAVRKIQGVQNIRRKNFGGVLYRLLGKR